MTSVADMIGGATPSSAGKYFEGDIVYPLVWIDSVQTRDGFKGVSFIAKCKVIEAKSEDIVPGCGRDFVVNLTKHKDTAPGNVKSFLMAASGLSENDCDGGFTAKVLASEDPFADGLLNRLIRLETKNVKTRAGGDFTVHDWETVLDTFQEQADALREAAGF